ncbi:uncharacterized protein (TIGR00369 family) [Mobiluncus mulieris]|uniref:Esterase YdiI n=1 Tax=Mobiluncus mulieris TaxID=2052 RepID=A0A8G2HVN6_9ACTO|nr:hotdog fold thioesterase [Mobiluncus mulieris]MBB5846148.1 uncharacterized protein (TIGR00369 family) [Mobiluncus mulieris]MCU9993677.1 hotdog fold thioesterase [Mobiluncus mulieris]STO17368.1 Esterase YdiI [Mobiluncus mulieris]
MNTKPTVGNIGETTTAKAGETRETAKAGEAGTKLGIEIRATTAESAEATMPVVGNRQPYGLLHGGATALLAEHTASVAAGAWAATHGMAAVGANLTITHVRPAQSGTVRCTAQAQHLGRRTAVYAFQVVSETSGKLISFGSVSCQLVAKNPDGAS